MATNPSTLPENTARIVAPDANYLYGSAQDDSTGTAGDGTPFKSALLNDIYGFQQAMLSEAAIVPSGSSDTAIASQYLDSLKVLFPLKSAVNEISGVWEWQDNVKQVFGNDADVEIDYDTLSAGLVIDLLNGANWGIRKAGSPKVTYDNSANRLLLVNSASLGLFDGSPLRFGTGDDVEVEYDSAADALEVRLDATADYKLMSNGVLKYDYDQSAGEHTFGGDVIINNQVKNSNDPLVNNDLARKIYVDRRIIDSTLFSGSVDDPNSATLNEAYTNFKQVIIKSVRAGAHSIMVIPTGIIVAGQDFSLATNGNETDGHALIFEFTDTTHVKVLDSDGGDNPLVQVIGAFRI